MTGQFAKMRKFRLTGWLRIATECLLVLLVGACMILLAGWICWGAPIL